MTEPKKQCSICGKTKHLTRDFWERKDGTRMDVCKECAGKSVDIKQPQTFLWVLKDIDIPFVEEIWVRMCKNAYKKDPYRFKPGAVLGRYISNVRNTRRFSNLTYKDTLKVNQDNINTRKMAQAISENSDANIQRLQQQVSDDVGFLSEKLKDDSIFGTLSDIPDELPQEPGEESLLNYDDEKDISQDSIPVSLEKIAEEEQKKREKEKQEFEKAEKERQEKEKANKQKNIPIIGVDEQEIMNHLSAEEIQHLAMKWGESFRPSEWIKMEDMYLKYCGEYEMNVDREETLKAMCKTNINMQRCLDSGDATNASRFSTMFDQLRKSGAFTEAQKKEDKEKYLDSVGELVTAVERAGGIIKNFDFEVEAPQDKVDLTLKDMQSYTYNLVKNEMGLGDLIETYIKKLEEDMALNKDSSLEDGLITSREEEQELKDEEVADNWLDHLEDEIAADADAMYAKIGEGEI